MATLPIILLNGTTADANQVMEDFYEIYSNIDPSNVEPPNKTGTGPFVLGTGAHLESPTINNGTFTGTSTFTGTVIFPSGGTPQIGPIGTIIPFYTFPGAFGGPNTFNSTYWRYCDGTAVPGVPSVSNPLGGLTLPDLSGRYLIGFGTDGGGDIGNPGALLLVGNANSQINIAHVHDLQNHVHSINSHTHTIAGDNHNHYNNGGGVGFTHHIADSDNPYMTSYGYWAKDDSMGWGSFAIRSDAAPSANEGQHDHYIDNYTHSHGGNTGGTSANTGAPVPNNTNSMLSAVQDIRPHSIQIRFIMRVQ